MKFKQSIIHWARLGVALRHFIVSLKRDIVDELLCPNIPLPIRNLLRGIPKQGDSSDHERETSKIKPLIFVSYATDESLKGSHLYCGGEKLLNNLVLLLRRKGYEAWMVSTDGSNVDWLAEHAPFLSIEEFIKKKRDAVDVRCVTSWMKALPFIEQSRRFYFWDHELSASSRSHFPILAHYMAEGRIVRTAGVNRTVAAFHRCVFEIEALALRQLIDEAHWTPDPSRRLAHRIGYFEEGDHGPEYVHCIEELTREAGFTLEFVQLAGKESEIISQMQECSVFMALNVGKSHLWGEGGPMSPQEAMACGTVPLCFDITGPWELIQQHYNGVIARNSTPEAMAAELIWIYSQAGRLEQMSRRALEISRISHSMEARWPEVARFLDLPL